MKKHIVKIKSIGFINYNILQIVTEKPENYDFEPGQATEIAINQKDWKEEKRPFTFTNLPREDDLQFTIKVYPSHDGVTEKLSKLKVGNELVLGEVFGAIQFKGKGTFLAGGAGITPFIAIFKSLEYQNEMNRNSLIFANKTEKDIFLKQEFETLLGRRNSKVSHRSYRRGLFEIYHNRFFTVFLCLRPTGK
ncbi:ferredoxin reductase domain-containing protein [Euzebyella saccharophila]|uniref:Flavodoxin reductase n=1 Tax=Euzebyella saccharophila TaxID=679664 RepID=A0ABV8JK77_9FLAO|nr:flavodoxin reductase [Euzebyella saccharophila]